MDLLLNKELNFRVWNCSQPALNPFPQAFLMVGFGWVFMKKINALLRSLIWWSFSSFVDGENSLIIHSNMAVLLILKARDFVFKIFFDSSDNLKLMADFIMVFSFRKNDCITKCNTSQIKNDRIKYYNSGSQ